MSPERNRSRLNLVRTQTIRSQEIAQTLVHVPVFNAQDYRRGTVPVSFKRLYIIAIVRPYRSCTGLGIRGF